jgi:DNA-binding PucR family transcriptional regulator
MRVFLEQNRDYRATAKMLFAHENTVRYRIGKVKEIIESHNAADDFCESFSIALKCRQIL